MATPTIDLRLTNNWPKVAPCEDSLVKIKLSDSLMTWLCLVLAQPKIRQVTLFSGSSQAPIRFVTYARMTYHYHVGRILPIVSFEQVQEWLCQWVHQVQAPLCQYVLIFYPSGRLRVHYRQKYSGPACCHWFRWRAPRLRSA